MTTDEYRAHPALNFSRAKFLLTSAAHFRSASDEDQEETDAMRFGTLAHGMILEGKNPLHQFAIKPAGMSFATKEGKAWRDAQTLPIITEEEANGLPRMAQAVADNPDAAAILRGCRYRETPIFFSLHGIECKALIDAHGHDGAGQWAVCDFKTAVDASPRGFSKALLDRHYDMQAAWYCDGLAQTHGLESPPWWVWIVAEKKPPFVTAVYTPELEVLESGRAKIRRALELYAECVASGEWPMPFRGVNTIQLPAWAKKEAS